MVLECGCRGLNSSSVTCEYECVGRVKGRDRPSSDFQVLLSFFIRSRLCETPLGWEGHYINVIIRRTTANERSYQSYCDRWSIGVSERSYRKWLFLWSCLENDSHKNDWIWNCRPSNSNKCPLLIYTFLLYYNYKHSICFMLK